MVVDLPAPFGPRKPTMVPCSTEKLIWSSAILAPYRFVRPLTSIILIPPKFYSETSIPVGPMKKPGLNAFGCRDAFPRHMPKIQLTL